VANINTAIKDIKAIETPTIICCGLGNLEQKFGEITLTNVLFRRKFGYFRNDSINSTKKINNLIVGSEQKSQHVKLMLKSSNFGENIAKQDDHGNYNCYLKVNLDSEKINFLKEFRVTTRIFQCFE